MTREVREKRLLRKDPPTRSINKALITANPSGGPQGTILNFIRYINITGIYLLNATFFMIFSFRAKAEK
jgi:hypothetical protein